MRRRFAIGVILGLVLIAACGPATPSSPPLTATTGQYFGARNEPSQVRQRDGVLELGADRTSTGLVSGEVRSPNFTFGTVTVRARLSAGTGMWPAIWLLHDEPARRGVPEIDIVEVPQRNAGARHIGHFTYHWTDNHGVARAISTIKNFDSDLTAGYHDYRVVWTAKKITWSVDGHQVMHVESSAARSSGTTYVDEPNGTTLEQPVARIPIYSGPMYLRVTNGVGSADSWPGAPNAQTPFPNAMRIASIEISAKGLRTSAAASGSFNLQR